MMLTARLKARNEEREARSEKNDGAMEAIVHVMLMTTGEWKGTAGGSNVDFHSLKRERRCGRGSRHKGFMKVIASEWSGEWMSHFEPKRRTRLWAPPFSS